jgi:hypothetical protein
MPCPIDKESLKFCAAFALLKRTEEAALSDNDDWKKKESAKIVAGKERDEQLNEIGKEWSRRESVVKKEYKARELKLFRRAAGSLAKIVDGK